LTGSNVVTDSNGNPVEVMDYYPFGGLRSDVKSGTYGGEKRKFTGHEYDSQMALTYMGARYYDASRGQFLSQDPVFLGVGSKNDPKKLQAYLNDPQNMHSYAYARNNPLGYVDPDGQFSWPFDLKTTVSLTKTGLQLGAGYASHRIQQEWRELVAARQSFLQWQEKHPNLKEGLILVVSVLGERAFEGEGSAGFRFKRIKTEFENVEIRSFGETIYKGQRNLTGVVQDIEAGRLESRRTYRNDKSLLPQQKEGYYQEYEVPNTPNYERDGAGPERIIRGEKGELYYTPDHYETFHPLNNG
jgi:RHS repeat-associated protein